MNVTISALLLSYTLSNSPLLVPNRQSIFRLQQSRLSKFVAPVVYSLHCGQISVFSTRFRYSLVPVLVATDAQIIRNKAITTTEFSNGRQDITFSGCLFFYCHNSKSFGGGISAQLASGQLSVHDCKFERCYSTHGSAGVSAQIDDGLITGTCFDRCSSGSQGRFASVWIRVNTKHVNPIQVNFTAVVNCDCYGDTFSQDQGKLTGGNWNFTRDVAIVRGGAFTITELEHGSIGFVVIDNTTVGSSGIIVSSEKSLELRLDYMNVISCYGSASASSAFVAGESCGISLRDAWITQSSFGSGLVILEDITSQIIFMRVRSDLPEPDDERVYKTNCKWKVHTGFTPLVLDSVCACALDIENWNSPSVPFFETAPGIILVVLTCSACLAVVVALMLCRKKYIQEATTATTDPRMFYREHFITDFVTEN